MNTQSCVPFLRVSSRRVLSIFLRGSTRRRQSHHVTRYRYGVLRHVGTHTHSVSVLVDVPSKRTITSVSQCTCPTSRPSRGDTKGPPHIHTRTHTHVHTRTHTHTQTPIFRHQVTRATHEDRLGTEREDLGSPPMELKRNINKQFEIHAKYVKERDTHARDKMLFFLIAVFRILTQWNDNLTRIQWSEGVPTGT